MALLDVTAGLPQMARGPTLLGMPLKQVSLITLTFQNSAVTLLAHYSRLMPPSGDHRYFASTAVLLTELVKLAISLTFAIYEVSRTLAPSTPATVLFQQIYNSVFKGDGWKLAIPATLYTLQNTLHYVAVENLDPVHYQVILQLKILTTAIFTVTILGRSLSSKKWISLIILTAGVSIVSIPSSNSRDVSLIIHDTTDHFFPRSVHELGQVVSNVGDVARELTKRGTGSFVDAGEFLVKRSATYEGIEEDQSNSPTMNYSVGLFAALAVAASSGLTGVYFEKVLKDPHTSASVWIRNIQLSFYSIVPAFLVGVVFKDGEEIAQHGFFDGYSWVVWALIILQASGGVLASLCIHYADNIAKNFATSISIIISFLFTLWFFTREVTFTFILGTGLVLLATYLYTGPDRKRGRPPPINIVTYEKTTIDPMSTPRPSGMLEVPNQHPRPSSRGRVYYTGGGSDHDRHIQQIIEHTSSLFPETPHWLSQRFMSATDDRNREGPANGLSQITNDPAVYEDLDDFDTQLNPLVPVNPFHDLLPGSLRSTDQTVLDCPQFAYQPSSIEDLPHNISTNQRISLPVHTGANKPSRVLGDASHHFRPFVTRDPDYRSPFQSNPHHHSDGYLELDRPSSVHGIQLPPDSPPKIPIIGELQRGTQLFTTPYPNAKTTPPVNSSLTGSSPSAEHSSPSTRVSLERQRQVARRNQLPPKWNEKFQLDLDHASNIPPIINNTLLVDPRQSLPDKFHTVFPFQLFNAVQSKCFHLVYETNENVVISAPTGSGKTAILEMAICKLVSSQKDGNFKIVYQAPTKSLCSEKARDWQAKFSHMNLKCVELTGDTSQAEARRVGGASIIVTTPEKWDSITRKWRDHRKLLELIRLVLIDEIHILKDTRGATLEAVVSRMKTIGGSIRFVAISATIPNVGDVAKWLGRDHNNQLEPARFEVFGEELRPVKLQRYVYGYEGASNDFIFEQALDGKLNLLLAKHSQRKPIMIFCFTRKSCQRTARSLAEWWSTCRAEDQPWPPPENRIPVSSQDLQELVRYGVAFHHAGLDAKDRAMVEASFLSGQLHVICCTSTLAVGVNLPCHTVVLKGTNHYTDVGSQEYSDLEVMQMLGRAGRPQFDSSATAIIMTRLSNVQRYQKLVSGEEILESTLHRNLLEHLNSEIGLGTIQNIQTAKKWISGTFLSVRVRQSPSLYNLENVQTGAGADEQMEEWCERDVKLLQDYGLVTKHTPLACTEYGQAMSRYMIQFETMKLLLSIPRAAGIEEMLTIICKAVEFKDFRFKPAERAAFRELNKSPLVLHPVRETVTLPWHKIFMIVQIYLGGVDLPTDKGTDLFRQDILREKRMIFDRLKRLVRCVIDCKAYESDGLGTKAALDLCRSIAAQAWENTPAQLSQIPGFGPVAVRKWISNGVHTVLGVAEKGPLDIERIASRNPPYGRGVQKMLENFPRLTLKADIVESKAPSFESNDPVSVTIRVRLGHHNAKAVPCWKDTIPALTFIALTSDGNLAYFWRGNMRKLEKSSGLDIKFPVALTAANQTIFCHFSCEHIVGTQVMTTLEPNIPASVFGNIRRQVDEPGVFTPGLADIEDNYDDISDEALLKALESPRLSNSLPSSEPSGLLDSPEEDYHEEDFPLIDDILSPGDNYSGGTLTKMENGRYICNHQCHNGGLTKLGKPCNHKCCREGVKKYRPPKPSNKPIEFGSASENNDFSQPHPKTSQLPDKTKQQSGKKGSSAHSTLMRPSANGVVTSQNKGDRPTHEVTRAKRTHPFDDPSTPKRAKTSHVDSPSSFLSNIEYVDLCNVSDDDAASPTIQTQRCSATQSQRRKLLFLHEEVKGPGVISPRLTQSFNVKPIPPNDSGNSGIPNNEGHVVTACDTTIYISDENDPFSDIYDDMSDLPDLDQVFNIKNSCEQQSSSNAASPPLACASDETLYPGVEPNLSFTTVDELQKASNRFDLPSTDGTVKASEPTSLVESPQELSFLAASSPLPVSNVAASASRRNSSREGDHFANASSPALIWHPENDSGSHPPNEATEPVEPAWVADFDSDLIDSLRGVVNFVD
ncbi:hypothetical protein NUW58_g3671 [Xylaria curta]|uniref:Uncharacterized protein n=1 Tax=Xylaria curta TaxID=42375 RepID=A0ACC1PAF4_9PEZI|nr:hypothetical protein NUW58_g3671 [Xylaria curta]